MDSLPRGASWSCEPFEIVVDEKDEKGNLRTEIIHLWKWGNVFASLSESQPFV